MDDANSLVTQARQAAARAHAPYSRFRVGAALRDANGVVHLGCNVENASSGLSNCAERSAIFAAISAGAPRPFEAIAVSCIDAQSGRCSPCGACRQVMAEHLRPGAPVYVDGLGEFTVADLLPHAFTL